MNDKFSTPQRLTREQTASKIVDEFDMRLWKSSPDVLQLRLSSRYEAECVRAALLAQSESGQGTLEGRGSSLAGALADGSPLGSNPEAKAGSAVPAGAGQTTPAIAPTGWRLVPEKATVLMLEVLAGPSAVGRISFSNYQQWEKQWQEQWERLLAECPATPTEHEHYTRSASGDNGWEIGANVRGLLERVKLHFQKGDPNDARYSGLSNEELADLFTARCVEASKEGELLYFEICNLLQRAKATALTPPATVEAWRPMVSAPLDGTEIEILFRHFDYWTSLKLDGKEKADEQWQAAQRAHWIDHNGGGWTWHGMAGTPVGWRPLDAIDSSANSREK